MEYWILFIFKNEDYFYLTGMDTNGNPIYTREKSKACRFYDFHSTLYWLNRSHGALTEHEKA